MKIDNKDIITLIVCIIIFTYAMHGKYTHENPPLPECVDIYDVSEVCKR